MPVIKYAQHTELAGGWISLGRRDAGMELSGYKNVEIPQDSLGDAVKSVKTMQMNWEGHGISSILSPQHMAIVIDFDRSTSKERSLHENGANIVLGLLRIATMVPHDNVDRYALALLLQLVEGDDETGMRALVDAESDSVRAAEALGVPVQPSRQLATMDELEESFSGVGLETSKAPEAMVVEDVIAPLWAAMLDLQNKDDWLVQYLALHIMAYRCSTGAAVARASEALRKRVIFVTLRQIGESSKHTVSGGLSCLKTILGDRHNRRLAVQQDALRVVANALSPSAEKAVLAYKAACCLWLISYEKDAPTVFQADGVLGHMLAVLQPYEKEKVLRMVLAAIGNLLGSRAIVDFILENDGMFIFKNLALHQWADEDLDETVQDIRAKLERRWSELCSFENFMREVDSGGLDMRSPVHKSEKFWKENITRFEENEFDPVRKLLHVLLTSCDEKVQAVALYDLGEFVRFHPRGRTVIQKLPRAKQYILELMEAKDPGVRKNALLCMQKLLLTNWEGLAKQGSLVK